MENAKKMIIISPEDLHRMQNQQQLKPSHDTVSELDREMLSLLSNKTLSDQEKWSQYQQVLQRYLHFTSQKRKPIHIPVVDVANTEHKHNTLDHEELASTFTKTYILDVKNLLKHISKRHDKIDWDDSGTVYIDGEKVQNSNIVDLLHDIIRAKKATRPPGWGRLMHALKDISTPTEFITNPFARQHLVELKGAQPLDKSVNQSIRESPPAKIKPETPRYSSTPVSRMRRGLETKWEPFKL